MIAPFNRRDSIALAAAAGLLAVVLTLTVLPGPPGVGLQSLGQAGAAVVATMLVLAGLLRGLPPDLALRPMAPDTARQALAPPPPDLARLRVALLNEALSWYRVDLYLDGVRVGQLRPGTALIQIIPPGAHALTLRLWLRRLGTAELINALPGTDTDIAIRGAGGSARHYSVERRNLTADLADRHIVPVAMPGCTLVPVRDKTGA